MSLSGASHPLRYRTATLGAGKKKERRPNSAHQRAKRQLRHAVASGGDMPPIGFVDRTAYYKTSGPTDEKVQWSGPVGDRATPWKKQLGDTAASSAPSLHGELSADGSSYSNGTSASRSRRRNVRKRPASASASALTSSISVLSMLEFERKAENKTRRPRTGSKERNPRSRALSNTSPFKDKLAESFAYNAANSQPRENGGIPPPARTSTNMSVASSLLSSTDIEKEETPTIPTDDQELPLTSSTIATGAIAFEESKSTSELSSSLKKRRKKRRKVKTTSNLEWATAFLGRVEKRLEGEEEMYKEFVNALRQGDGTLGSVQTVAKAVLSEHADLMQELDDYIRRSMVKNSLKQTSNAKQHRPKSAVPASRSASSRNLRRTGMSNLSASSSSSQSVMHSSNSTTKIRRRKKKGKHWNWILDVAKTTTPTEMKKVTLARLQRIPTKIHPKDYKRPKSAYPTGRYANSGGSGRFSTAFPMTDLERKILDASRCPGPSDYQDPGKKRILPGGGFSNSNPKSDVDWIIYRAKQLPGPLDYQPELLPTGASVGKISDANPKNYLEWAVYYSKQTPGPDEYDINLCP